MLQTMDKTSGNVIGYRLIGDVTKADYDTLDPAIGAAVKQYGTVKLLFDLSQFHWEKVNAWASDVDFGKTYKNDIAKMALVGDAKWVRPLVKAAGPFYAMEMKAFDTDNDAWDWLSS